MLVPAPVSQEVWTSSMETFAKIVGLLQGARRVAAKWKPYQVDAREQRINMLDTLLMCYAWPYLPIANSWWAASFLCLHHSFKPSLFRCHKLFIHIFWGVSFCMYVSIWHFYAWISYWFTHLSYSAVLTNQNPPWDLCSGNNNSAQRFLNHFILLVFIDTFKIRVVSVRGNNKWLALNLLALVSEHPPL